MSEKPFKPLGFFVFDPLGDLEFFNEHGPAAAHADELVAGYRSVPTEEDSAISGDEAAEAVMVGIVLSFPGMLGSDKVSPEIGSDEKVTLN